MDGTPLEGGTVSICWHSTFGCKPVDIFNLTAINFPFADPTPNLTPPPSRLLSSFVLVVVVIFNVLK